MLVTLLSILLAVAPAWSLDHGRHPLTAMNIARDPAPTQATTVNCAMVSCGTAGALRAASSFCASYTGSITTKTVTPKTTLVEPSCSGSTTATSITTTSTIKEPYCLHPAYPKSAMCSCLSIPSSYTVTVTSTAPVAFTTFTGPFKLSDGNGQGFLQALGYGNSATTLVLDYSGEFYEFDQFALRPDGALLDLSLAYQIPPPVAYQSPSPSGGPILFDTSDPHATGRPLLNCSIGASDCSLNCVGVGGSSGVYHCQDGEELDTSLNANGECTGPYNLTVVYGHS